jgi:eukaryotic-like serine/threonine-protein kinase
VRPLDPGTRVGPYRCVRELGRGGMAVVVEAVDERTGATVALKVLRQEWPDPEARRRFEREQRAAISIEHPALARVLDVGEREGTLYLAMEKLDGSLAQRLRAQGPLPWREAAAICAAVARALSALHAASLVHRDVKPANLLLARDGTVRLADLGLVHADATTGYTRGGLTRTGEVVGTPEYVAPEQIEALRAPDARTDLYALGASACFSSRS